MIYNLNQNQFKNYIKIIRINKEENIDKNNGLLFLYE